MENKEYLLVVIILFAIFILFVALVFAFIKTNNRNKRVQVDDYSALEILSILEDSNNTLERLKYYSDIAKMHYNRYMGEVENFDLKVVAILSSHKSVNAKLVLEVERYFKNENPSRKQLIDKALGAGLSNR